jgi:hypothetical protein
MEREQLLHNYLVYNTGHVLYVNKLADLCTDKKHCYSSNLAEPNDASFFQLADTVLRTVSLRANVMYGEGDPYYVTNGLRTARANGGILQRVGHGRALFQQAYVGNTAYAFLCADRALRSNPDLGSQVFYVPDDTPVQNTFCFMKPYLSSRGYRLSTWSIPYPITYWSLCLVEMVLWLISPLIKINLKVTSCSVRYINTDLYFSYQKARRLLNYWPIFSPQVAHQRSLEYYKFTKL